MKFRSPCVSFEFCIFFIFGWHASPCSIAIEIFQWIFFCKIMFYMIIDFMFVFGNFLEVITIIYVFSMSINWYNFYFWIKFLYHFNHFKLFLSFFLHWHSMNVLTSPSLHHIWRQQIWRNWITLTCIPWSDFERPSTVYELVEQLHVPRSTEEYNNDWIPWGYWWSGTLIKVLMVWYSVPAKI